ncbi:hypothetical protein [Glaciecola sp. 1036]|uniref:hypothetical protein n=1 Tax=Alteromonadaceae TaxID=72275 RepID=UPI003D0874DA
MNKLLCQVCLLSVILYSFTAFNLANAEENQVKPFAKGIRGFWVTRIKANQNIADNTIINLMSLKIPRQANNPPYKQQSKFGSVNLNSQGKTCTFEVVSAIADSNNVKLAVSLSPFYQVNKKGKIKGNEKALERCRAIGLDGIDFYAVKPKLLGGIIRFENGDVVHTLFEPQGGASLKLGSVNIVAKNAELFSVNIPEPAIEDVNSNKINPKDDKLTKTKPPKNSQQSAPKVESTEEPFYKDNAFTLKHPNFNTFYIPVYDGIPALVSNGLLSTGSKKSPSYQENFSPSNQQDWQQYYTALRDFLDIVSMIDNEQLVRWYKTSPGEGNSGASTYEIALDKRRADWMLNIITKAFLTAAKIDHIHKYFCPEMDKKSVQFTRSRCSTFQGDINEQKRLLSVFLNETIPELTQYAEPLKQVNKVSVVNWALISNYDSEQQGFVVSLFSDFTFTPYGAVVTESASDFARKFKESYPVFKTMYIGSKDRLSGAGSTGALLPMDIDAAQTFLKQADANQKRLAAIMTIELIPENIDDYAKRILNDKKLTSREYRYKLVSENVELFQPTKQGMVPVHTFPVDVEPVK